MKHFSFVNKAAVVSQQRKSRDRGLTADRLWNKGPIYMQITMSPKMPSAFFNQKLTIDVSLIYFLVCLNLEIWINLD